MFDEFMLRDFGLIGNRFHFWVCTMGFLCFFVFPPFSLYSSASNLWQRPVVIVLGSLFLFTAYHFWCSCIKHKWCIWIVYCKIFLVFVLYPLHPYSMAITVGGRTLTVLPLHHHLWVSFMLQNKVWDSYMRASWFVSFLSADDHFNSLSLPPSLDSV